MTGTLVVRCATETDHAAILGLMERFEAHLTAIDPTDPTCTPPERLAALVRFALGPWPCRGVLMAECLDRPLGFLAFSEIVWMDDGAPALWMSDLYVEADMRCSGVGRALIDAASEQVRIRGGRRLVFTVWEKNGPARRFYEHLGASPVAGEITLSLTV
jgi:GNAT superfamily N-acetyltransferase